MIDGEIMQVEPENLVTEVLKLKHREVTYSFGKEYKMVGLRLVISPDTEIVSISDIYEPAFLYENEIHDLFGIPIKMITLDYHGNLYRIKQEAPFRG